MVCETCLSRKKFILPKLICGLSLLLFSTFSCAATSDPNISKARRLLDQGHAEQSAALLLQDLASYAGNAEYDYLLGLALYKSGQTGEAIFAFERVLMSDPNNVDARLKAAQISVERGNPSYARELLQPISKPDLSKGQQLEYKAIVASLGTVSDKASFAMRGYLLGGIAHDDNVTSGPSQSQLIIPGYTGTVAAVAPNPGVPVTPTPNVTPTSTTASSTPTNLGSAAQAQDMVGILEAGLSLQQAVGEETWLTADGNIHQSSDRIRSDVSYGFSNLNLGIFTRSGQELFGVSALGQTYLVANAIYRDTLGGQLSWAHSFEEGISLTSYFQHLTFIYPNNAIDNVTHTVAGMTLATTISGNSLMQFGAYAGHDDALDSSKPQFSFHLTGISLGTNLAFSNDLMLSAAANFESRNHDSVDPLYFFTRIDSLLIAGASLDYITAKSWHIIPSYSYIRNASNAALYDYTRNILLLQLKWDFDNEKE